MDKLQFLRERFEKGNRYYGSFGINAQTSQLRIEVPTVKGQGVYDFDLRKEVKRATEKTLKRNDLFVATAIGVGLMVEANALKGHSPILTYPMLHDVDMPTGVYGFTNNHAEVLYNGVLTLKTGQNVNYSGFPLDKFRVVPETQGSDITLAQVKHDDFMYLLPEEVRFAGTQDHKIRVEFPAVANTDIAGPADTTAFIVLVIDGYLYEGATNEKYKTAKTETGLANPYANAI